MCRTCHSSYALFSNDGLHMSFGGDELDRIAADHGDNNSDCIRKVIAPINVQAQYKGSSYVGHDGSIYQCVDCGEPVRAMDSDDHNCYTDG